MTDVPGTGDSSPRITARSRGLTTERCPSCHAPVLDADNEHACPVCGTRHHAECYRENGGCTLIGCTGRVDRATEIEEDLERIG
jgi:hypothetical protein